MQSRQPQEHAGVGSASDQPAVERRAGCPERNQ
jgi:hypothetical protein